jgi:hypothetical protein
MMIGEFFRALFSAGIPVAVTSYLLAWWALKNGYFERADSVKGLEKEVKRLTGKKSKKDKKRSKNTAASDPERNSTEFEKAEPIRHKMNPVHNKWLSFGGGFYGVVALMTYGVIELGEVRDFIANLGGFFQMLSNLSLNLIIGFLVNSFMNFFWAMAWPAYWLSEISSNDIWLWFLLAYGGYWAGTRYALHRVGLEQS